EEVRKRRCKRRCAREGAIHFVSKVGERRKEAMVPTLASAEEGIVIAKPSGKAELQEKVPSTSCQDKVPQEKVPSTSSAKLGRGGRRQWFRRLQVLRKGL